MFKSLFISIWAIIVTIGVVFVPSMFAGDPDSDQQTSSMIDHRTDTMSAALFEKGMVIGHFTTRILYQLPDGAVDPEVIPVDQILLDALFELIHKSDPKELAKLGEPELMIMGDQLATLLNSRSTPIPATKVRFDRARLMLK